MKIKWDFSELIDFKNNIRPGYNSETALMTATQNIARVLHKHLLRLTPVDTGNLRKMWSAGDNLMFLVETIDGGYEVTLINVAKNEKGYMYGSDVEDGHRTPSGGYVVGRFFVKNSIDLTKNQIEAVVMKELRKWWDNA